MKRDLFADDGSASLRIHCACVFYQTMLTTTTNGNKRRILDEYVVSLSLTLTLTLSLARSRVADVVSRRGAPSF